MHGESLASGWWVLDEWLVDVLIYESGSLVCEKIVWKMSLVAN